MQRVTRIATGVLCLNGDSRRTAIPWFGEERRSGVIDVVAESSAVAFERDPEVRFGPCAGESAISAAVSRPDVGARHVPLRIRPA